MRSLSLVTITVAAALSFAPAVTHAGPAKAKKKDNTVSIALDASGENVVVSWTGQGALKQASSVTGKSRVVHKGHGKRGNVYVAPATADQTIFTVEGSGGSGVVSANIVGYVNLTLPPGLSLIANPLHFTNSTVGFWFPSAPDGCQIYILDANGNYDVTTFDALLGWSNPDMPIPIGAGFYFHNPSTASHLVTFVGEVPQGELINPLPAGISIKGALVPQSGSINTLHQIPGEPGDQLQVYINDQNGSGAYITSTYTTDTGWDPDLTLDVGQGFWIQKQNPQDWVRYFSAF